MDLPDSEFDLLVNYYELKNKKEKKAQQKQNRKKK